MMSIVALHCEMHRRGEGRLRRDARLEKPVQLDNMLTNEAGRRKPVSKGERTPMRKTLFALLLAASVTPAMAQEKTFELKLSHWVPASHPLQKALEEWGAAVEKESGGTVKSKVFPAQQLGKAFDHYDMARDGIADVTYINPGYQPGRFPIIGAGELPFLMPRAARWRSTPGIANMPRRR
jgi:TRAP-type mannitol/chloroaromatic compound transport system substrate-binding protein